MQQAEEVQGAKNPCGLERRVRSQSSLWCAPGHGALPLKALNFFEAPLSSPNAPMVFRVVDHVAAPAWMGWRRHGNADGTAGPARADLWRNAACQRHYESGAEPRERGRLGGNKRLWRAHSCAGYRQCHGYCALRVLHPVSDLPYGCHAASARVGGGHRVEPTVTARGHARFRQCRTRAAPEATHLLTP